MAVGNKNRHGNDEDREAVVVLVQRKLPFSALSANNMDAIPSNVAGVVTDVVEIGYPRAYESHPDVILSENRKNWKENIPAGISMGHHKITAGTYGAMVRSKETGEIMLLSNNHVFANSNDAKQGDNILQPGSYDGGTQADSIAHLEDFVPIMYLGEPAVEEDLSKRGFAEIVRDIGNFLIGVVGVNRRLYVKALPVDKDPVNYVDAAIAKPFTESDFIDEILAIGKVSGWTEASINQKVRKMGRTTGYTEGYIQLLNATVDVAYGADRVARFQNQLIIKPNSTNPFSQGGDSGSLIVDQHENKAVGLLFAGSDVATIANPISLVLSELSITI